jgi:hypothetical protein
MPKFIKLFFTSLMVVLGLAVLSQPIKAAVLQLTSIGNSLVPTTAFTTWTYVGENPVFVGKASAAAQVTILLNSATNRVTADSLGDWVFTPTTLLVGTHSVTISSGSESKAFSLVIASDSAGTTGSASATPTPTGSASAGVGGAETLPQSGGMGLTLMVTIFGMAVLGLGLMGWSSIQAASLIRQSELNED